MADTSSLLTRCPHCDTRFRVTGKQLGIADGKVRCGHCMEVFDARSHTESPAASPAGNPSRSDDRSDLFTRDPDDDLIFQDNPEEDAADGPYAGQNSRFDDDELSDSFRGFEPGTEQTELDDNDIDKVDESWAEAMLQEELPDQAPEQHSGATPDDLTASRDTAPWEEPRNPEVIVAPDSPTPGPHSTAQDPQDPQDPQDQDAAYEPDIAAITDDLEMVEMTTEAEPGTGASSLHAESSHDRLTGNTFPPLDDGSPYDGLSREPVSVGSRSGRSVRGWLWTLVILALLAGLVSQAAWFQFDRLSTIPELRPWYEKACQYAGCELAPLVAIDRIQSRKLVVRTDPDDRNALLVDAVIINQAEFEQPFPAIALTFSNLNGDVVAQSVFSPENYLAGDGSELTAMPPGTPVRIAISIRDPGRDAVNYNLRFVNRSDNS